MNVCFFVLQHSRMHFTQLRFQNLRCFKFASLAPGTGLNFLQGPNGAGKTTVLEAMYLLSHGRSFRSGGQRALIRSGQSGYQLRAQVSQVCGHVFDVGLLCAESRQRAFINELPISQLSKLLHRCAVVCFEPGSHVLISGPGDIRRHFLDWGLFHVEPTFPDVIRQYRRSLAHRNALLRAHGEDREMQVWEAVMSENAEHLDAWRENYLHKLEPHTQRIAFELIPELGLSLLEYRRGWKTGASLSDCLRDQRSHDRRLGFTRPGAHRADWRIYFTTIKERNEFSRGQEKLISLVVLLAQAALHTEWLDEPVVLCVDDLNSELDPVHRHRLVQYLRGIHVQVFWTGTERPDDLPEETCVFHVEHQEILPDQPRLG